MSINKAIVVGNLGRDPEVRALPSGQERGEFLSRNQGAIQVSAISEQAHLPRYDLGTAWSLSYSVRSCCSPFRSFTRRKTGAALAIGPRRVVIRPST